jgi:hypothetical protein
VSGVLIIYLIVVCGDVMRGCRMVWDGSVVEVRSRMVRGSGMCARSSSWDDTKKCSEGYVVSLCW